MKTVVLIGANPVIAVLHEGEYVKFWELERYSTPESLWKAINTYLTKNEMVVQNHGCWKYLDASRRAEA